MAEKTTKTDKLEREYIIPLRRFWLGVPQYERTGRAVKTIKKFIAKHMKVFERNVDNVKLDVYLNNELWFKGRANPPAKVKVKAIREGDIVKVIFAETPQYVRFLKSKHEKMHKKADKPVEKPASQEAKTEHETKKTEEQKTDEKEKEKAVEEMSIKQAETQQKAQKHITKIKEPRIQRMALKK